MQDFRYALRTLRRQPVFTAQQGIATASTGIALGLAASFALARYLQSLLFGVRPHDVPVFAAAAALLFVVALFACYVPARRATRIEPMSAVRDS